MIMLFVKLFYISEKEGNCIREKYRSKTKFTDSENNCCFSYNSEGSDVFSVFKKLKESTYGADSISRFSHKLYSKSRNLQNYVVFDFTVTGLNEEPDKLPSYFNYKDLISLGFDSIKVKIRGKEKIWKKILGLQSGYDYGYFPMSVFNNYSPSLFGEYNDDITTSREMILNIAKDGFHEWNRFVIQIGGAYFYIRYPSLKEDDSINPLFVINMENIWEKTKIGIFFDYFLENTKYNYCIDFWNN